MPDSEKLIIVILLYLAVMFWAFLHGSEGFTKGTETSVESYAEYVESLDLAHFESDTIE